MCERVRETEDEGNTVEHSRAVNEPAHEGAPNRSGVYLGRLAEANHIDPSLHQALHNVIHCCIGVSAGQDGSKGAFQGGRSDHDLHEC